MEKDNWEKGDIAICVKVGNITDKPGFNPPVKLYGEYIVGDVNVCSCGAISLDIGLGTHVEGRPTLCKCDVPLPRNGTHWCDSVRFVKKQTKEMVELELAAAVEAENFELAKQLHDRLISL